ncbi:MAG: hypothetical protein E6J75_14280, partial [Deltaproteobacteria bacterium]
MPRDEAAVPPVGDTLRPFTRESSAGVRATRTRMSANQKRLLAFLVVLAAALRLWCFIGYGRGDDPLYVVIAKRLLDEGSGFFTPATFAYGVNYRLGLYVPVAMSFALLGVNEFSYVLYPLLASLGSIVLVCLIGTALFDAEVGLIAAVLVAVSPFDVAFASTMVIDLASSFLTALAVYGPLGRVLGEGAGDVPRAGLSRHPDRAGGARGLAERAGRVLRHPGAPGGRLRRLRLGADRSAAQPVPRADGSERCRNGSRPRHAAHVPAMAASRVGRGHADRISVPSAAARARVRGRSGTPARGGRAALALPARAPARVHARAAPSARALAPLRALPERAPRPRGAHRRHRTRSRVA